MGDGFSIGLRLYTEGQAKFYTSDLSRLCQLGLDYTHAPIFYNPNMGANRDIAVAALRILVAEGKGTAIDAMTASGIRALRFALEAGPSRVIANDSKSIAASLARRNAAMNRVEEIVEVTENDANALMEELAFKSDRFWLVDLDPFGSPAPFVRSALRAVRRGGVVALTATDEPPLFGIERRKLLKAYGVWGIRTDYHKEFGLRTLIGYAAREAAKQSMIATPIFGHVTRHYVRAYLSVDRGAERADRMLRESLGWILHCGGCNHRELVPNTFEVPISRSCPYCGHEMTLMGPVWVSSYVEPEFGAKLLENLPQGSSSRFEASKIVDAVVEEAEAPPLYFLLDVLSSELGMPTPSTRDVIRALKEAGYDAVKSHVGGKAIKTNASIAELKRLLIQHRDRQ